MAGEAGVGKSTTVNALTGSSFTVSDSAVGVTLAFQSATNDGGVEFVDTIGLSEGQNGSVPPALAFAKLVHFVRRQKKGFNGIFFVTNNPRITDKAQANYKLFIQVLTQGKTPCYLFVNQQELSDDFRGQYNRNKDFYKCNGFAFEDGFAGGWKTAEAANWTRECFFACITSAASDKAVPLFQNGTTFWTYVNRVFEAIVGLIGNVFGTPIQYDATPEGSIEDSLRQLGAPTKLARYIADNVDSLDDNKLGKLERGLRSCGTAESDGGK